MNQPSAKAGTRACGHSSQGDGGAGEIDQGGKAFICFLVARGDAPKLLQGTEEVFEEMTPFVHLEVAWDGLFSAGFGRDDRLRPTLVQVQSQGVVVEGLVSEQSAEIQALQDRLGADAVVALAGQQDEADQVPERINQGQARIFVVSPPLERPMA